MSEKGSEKKEKNGVIVIEKHGGYVLWQKEAKKKRIMQKSNQREN